MGTPARARAQYFKLQSPEPSRCGRGRLDAAVLRELVLHALGDVQEAGGLRLDGCGYVRRPLLHMRNRPL